MRFRFSPLVVAVSLALSFSSQVTASPTDLETEEYKSSGALDIIKASQAYDLGYTGQGLTIGILDTAVRIDHPELAGKAEMLMNSSSGTQTWDNDNTHGSHVAGIMAAKRDGIGMHGVAFDAEIWSGDFLNEYTPLDLNQYFATHPEVRIFNNSWGYTEYIPMFGADGKESSIENFAEILSSDIELVTIAVYAHEQPQSVFVFAAGNDGEIAPGFTANLPRYLNVGDLTNWINVGSVNANNGCITTGENGELILNSASIPWFTNLSKGAELFTVMAPGSNIFSLDARTNGYMLDSGTSMSAPVVTGALALVAQAHPWMNGKQLADAVLTTANNSFEAPKYAIQYRTADFNPADGDFGTIRLVIIADNKEQADKFRESGTDIDGTLITINADTESVMELLDKQIEQDPSAWVGGADFARQAVADGNFVIEVLTREEVFGQGILDVGKAVRGPARLDANRMTADNVLKVAELQKTYAIETFDTQGYTSEFSNDISERKWEDRYHHEEYQTTGSDNKNAQSLKDKSVGLLKTGTGTLILSGYNTYEGATIVEEGVLVIAQRADTTEVISEEDSMTSGTLQKSSVVVRENGILSGDGFIEQALINNGTVRPGWRGDTLTVGNYTQGDEATLAITFDAEGNHAKLKVENDATLAGTLVFVPERNLFYRSAQYDLAGNVIEINGNSTGELDLTAQTDSPTLDVFLITSGNDYFVAVDRPSDAYSQWAQNSAQAGLGNALSAIAQNSSTDMQALISAIDWSGADGRGVTRALNVLGPGAFAEAARSGLIEQSEFNVSILSHMLNARFESSRSPVAGDAFWVMPYRTDAREDSTGYGLMAGFDTTLQQGLTLGGHLIVSESETEMNELGGTDFESKGVHLGAQMLYGPRDWRGAYVAGGLRFGLQDAEMNRDVTFPGYSSRFKTDWTQVSGSTFLAAGKDWTRMIDDTAIAVGPVAWAEYSFVRRPSVTEKEASAAALHTKAQTYDSLLLSAGFRASLSALSDDRHSVGTAQFLTAWRYEVLDAAYRTEANFVGYGANRFVGESEKRDKDALLVQMGLHLSVDEKFQANLDVGSEFFTDDHSGVNLGLKLGWMF